MARRRRPPRPGALTDLAPLRILAHIALLQLSYYSVAIILIVFVTLTAGGHVNAGQIFDWRLVRGDVTTGWTLALCWMLDSLITVIPILLMVARSKLVPDFALTIHFFHLVVVSLFVRAIPTSPTWWLLQIASSALMVFLGMWACQWRELRPMAFGGKSKDRNGALSTQNGHAVVAHEDSAGFEMGIRQGRGTDGAGIYEMVGTAPKEPA